MLSLVLKRLDDDQAEDIVTIDLHGKSSMCDYMVIASGRSQRQVAAMAEHLSEQIKALRGMAPAVDVICAEAEEAVRSKGYNIIILSDRRTGPDRIPIPSLLATSAVHHHLIRQGLRTSVGLVVETGEAHEVHQFCTLAGYGAEAINPYLAFDTLAVMTPELGPDLTPEDVKKKYIKAIGKALLKVMAKMGISTYQSYCGAQIFDAVGLRTPFVRKYFTGTHTQIEGIGMREIARETFDRHAAAFGNAPVLANALDVGGDYAYRVRGEAHVWRPNVVADLQHAVRSTDPADAMAGRIPQKYRDFAKAIDAQSEQLLTIRGLFRIRSAESMGRKPVPLDEVEPASEIVKRFATGAMSFGSISREAHTTLALAMNRIGGGRNPRPARSPPPCSAWTPIRASSWRISRISTARARPSTAPPRCSRRRACRATACWTTPHSPPPSPATVCATGW